MFYNNEILECAQRGLPRVGICGDRSFVEEDRRTWKIFRSHLDGHTRLPAKVAMIFLYLLNEDVDLDADADDDDDQGDT